MFKRNRQGVDVQWLGVGMTPRWAPLGQPLWVCLVCLLCLLACSDTDTPTVAATTVPKPMKVDQESNQEATSMHCDTQRQPLQGFEKSALIEKQFDGPDDESSEGALVHSYRDSAGQLKMITVSYFGGMGRRDLTYRLVDANTFELSITDVQYDHPIAAGTPITVTAEQTSYYAVCDGALVSGPERNDPQQTSASAAAATLKHADHQAALDRLAEYIQWVDEG